MDLVHSVAELRRRLGGEASVVLVPTMGNLHAGHLALVEEARRHGACIVASIFVDRLQLADDYHLPGHLGVFDAAFAGLWFSHVPIEARRDFLASLHARLEPGSRLVFLDNSAVQLNDFSIAETDRHGNTYQHRTLRDGTTHRVLKNFPTEQELVGMLAGAATVTYYRPLQNFWLLEYRLNAP